MFGRAHLRFSALGLQLLLALSTLSAQTEIYIPQVISGLQAQTDYVTEFHLVNLSATPVSVSVGTYLNDGQPMEVLPPGEDPSGSPGALTLVSLQALGQATIRTDTSLGLKVGWARILSSGPVGVVATLTAYTIKAGRTPLTSTSIIPQNISEGFSAYALVSPRARSGIAVLNPSTSDSTQVRFRLVNRDGAESGSRSITLLPGNKVAQFLDEGELFTDLEEFEGSVEVTSSGPLAATVIRVEDTSWTAFGVFSARQIPSGPQIDVLPNVIGIDFESFPRDPDSYAGPERFVSPAGSDETGDGSRENPYRTIFYALSVAQPGEIVTVRGGTYREGPGDEFRALLIERDGMVLRAEPGESVTVEPSGQHITYGLELSSSHVVVDGIHLNGFTSSGISLGSSSTTQQNVVIKNLTVTMAQPGDGIVMYTDLTGSGGVASSGLLIKNVSVVGANLGISCNAGPCNNWRLENVVVRNRAISGDSGADAVAIENGDNFLLLGGEVTGAGGDGIDIKADRALVYNAHVHHVGRNAVKFWQRGELVNSLLHHSGADASVVLDGGPKVRILNSVVAYHNYQQGSSYVLTAGYDVPNQPLEVEIINSVFYNNSGGLYFSPASQVSVRNCLFTGHENGKVMEVTSRTTSERLEVRLEDEVSMLSAHGLGSGNLPFGTDPGFFQPGAGVFGFGAASPLVDGGVVAEPFPVFDRLFRDRLRGSGPDLGPDELH